MRAFLLIAALAACGDDGTNANAHETIACTPGKWGTTTMCERACAAGATGTTVDADMNGLDDTCGMLTTGLGLWQCPIAEITVFEGERGCCVKEASVKFYACVGQ